MGKKSNCMRSYYTGYKLLGSPSRTRGENLTQGKPTLYLVMVNDNENLDSSTSL